MSDLAKITADGNGIVFNFSQDEKMFALELRHIMDVIMTNRNIVQQNAVVIPHRYAVAIVCACGEKCSIPADRGPHLVCEYGDFKIFTSPNVHDVHFTFQAQDGDITNKDLYEPFMGLFKEDK